jgi:hypothetical protein
MNMVYTESIFILLVITSVYFLYQGQTGKAAFAAFLLPLTRWIGILFVATLVVAGALRLLRGEDNARLLGSVPASVQAIFACAMAPVVGAGVYVLLMAALTGDPMAHVHGAHLFPSHWSLGNVVRPDLLVREFFKTPLDVHSHVSSIIDRVFFVAFLASAPLVYRRVDKPLFVYYLSIGLVPLLGSFMSYTRYVLPAFPLYIAYADAFAQKQRLMLVIVVTMVILQYFFIGLHVRNLWVA